MDGGQSGDLRTGPEAARDRGDHGTEDALRALAAALQAGGAVSEGALARAEQVAERRGDRVDRVLTQLGLVSEERVAAAWAQVLGHALVAEADLARVEPLTEGLRFEYLRSRLALPERLADGAVRVIQGDPLDAGCRSALGFALGGPVVPAVAAPSAILAALERAAPDRGAAVPETGGQVDLDIDRLRDLASDAPVVQWVTGMLDAAVGTNASDIHIDPDGNGIAVRLRIDGLLRPHDPPPPALSTAIVSRIKILARLDIAERRLPQDGRASTTVRGRAIDLRVATAPTPAGETVVIRVLDGTGGAGGAPTLAGLGFGAPERERLLGISRRPSGIVLVTGPTGAGKTTTLYALLRALTDPARKVITVEDPVEYALPGITQIQANERIGLGFATVLRSILRHNPDRVMVGEIRDTETAAMAAEAALTGHPVLSTLHTNSAAGAITRLREMGVAPYLLASALAGVAAQRLVRRLCDCCGGAPAGCERCRGEGYRGRTVVAEILSVDAALRAAILDGAPEAELARLARETGMQPLSEHARAKAAAGEIAMADALGLSGEG